MVQGRGQGTFFLAASTKTNFISYVFCEGERIVGLFRAFNMLVCLVKL